MSKSFESLARMTACGIIVVLLSVSLDLSDTTDITRPVRPPPLLSSNQALCMRSIFYLPALGSWAKRDAGRRFQSFFKPASLEVETSVDGKANLRFADWAAPLLALWKEFPSTDLIVEDDGAGSGLLTQIALKRAARRVIAIERYGDDVQRCRHQLEHLGYHGVVLGAGQWQHYRAKSEDQFILIHDTLEHWMEAPFELRAAVAGGAIDLRLMNLGPYYPEIFNRCLSDALQGQARLLLGGFSARAGSLYRTDSTQKLLKENGWTVRRATFRGTAALFAERPTNSHAEKPLTLKFATRWMSERLKRLWVATKGGPWIAGILLLSATQLALLGYHPNPLPILFAAAIKPPWQAPFIISQLKTASNDEQNYFSFDEWKNQSRATPLIITLLHRFTVLLRRSLAEVSERRFIEFSFDRVKIPKPLQLSERPDNPMVAYFSSHFRKPRILVPRFIDSTLLIINSLTGSARRTKLVQFYGAWAEFVVHDYGHIAEAGGAVIRKSDLHQQKWQTERQTLIRRHGLTKEETKALSDIEEDHRAEVYRLALPTGRRRVGSMGELLLDGADKEFSDRADRIHLIEVARDVVLSEYSGLGERARTFWKNYTGTGRQETRLFARDLIHYLRTYRGAWRYDRYWTSPLPIPAYEYVYSIARRFPYRTPNQQIEIGGAA